MILPLALVSVGYAQELNCWGLRPARIDEEKSSEYSSLNLCPDREEPEELADGYRCCEYDEQEDENSTHEP
jgi:hypothetical protein